MNQDKIVITGVGALAPNGNNVNEFWSNLTEGISGIAPITYFNTDNHKVKIAGELKNISADPVIDSKEIRKLDPFSIYAILATHEAMEMSGLNYQSFDERTCSHLRCFPTILFAQNPYITAFHFRHRRQHALQLRPGRAPQEECHRK